jgi:SAM-dependent methyltransferase
MKSVDGPLVNVDQAAAWDGHEGDRWTETEEHLSRALQRHSDRLIRAASIGRAEHVLDIGCGCGESTRRAARLADAGNAFGVDLSHRMLERARRRCRDEGLSNARFEQADAQVHSFERECFDIALSQFGGMFFADPVAAYTNIGRALRSDGRIALLVWQEVANNDWMRILLESLSAGRSLPAPPIGTPGPFGLADPESVRGILTDAGYANIEFEDVREPYWFGSDVSEAFEFASNLPIATGALKELDEPTKARALDELATALAGCETDDGVVLESAAWIVSARRIGSRQHI